MGNPFGLLHLKAHGDACVACKVEALAVRLADLEAERGLIVQRAENAEAALAEAERLLREVATIPLDPDGNHTAYSLADLKADAAAWVGTADSADDVR